MALADPPAPAGALYHVTVIASKSERSGLVAESITFSQHVAPGVTEQMHPRRLQQLTSSALSALGDPGQPPVPAGSLRKFTLVLGYINVPYSNANGSGVKRVVAVNGTSPGPEIRVQHGDTLQVTVINNLDTATTIHWHGFSQQTTPWADGVGGVSQCLEKQSSSSSSSNSALVYTFRATLSGTFWYHGHALDEYVDGLIGPLIVAAVPEPYAKRYSAEWTWQIADWYNSYAHDLEAVYTSSADPDGFEPMPDAVWVNGKFSRALTYAAAARQVVRVRAVNSAAFSTFKVSVDGLPLQVIEIDGQPVQPYTVPFVYLSVAQRVSFLLDFSQLPPALAASPAIQFNVHAFEDSYPLGPSADYGWQGVKTLDPDFYGLISLKTTRSGAPNYTVTYTPLDAQLTGFPAPDYNLVAAKPIPSYSVPAATHFLQYDVVFKNTPDNRNLAYVNDVTYQDNSTTTEPILFRVIKLGPSVKGAPTDYLSAATDGGIGNPPTQIPMTQSSRFYIPLGAWVDINVRNYDGGLHPLHIHGHRFFIVDTSEVPGAAAANGPNYLQRDVATVAASPDGVTPATLRLRFYANNPGVFLLHCHIDWHMDAGLSAVLVEGDSVLSLAGPLVPTAMLNNCGYSRG